jgi:3-oxoacyl-[acyl-carrier-protein] synthase III
MIHVLGTGSYLPEKILTNHDLSKMVDTSDDWIFKRTGIKERRIASADEATSDLAAKAAEKALKKANVKSKDIELIVVGTSTPDYPVPAVAPIIQRKLKCGNAIAYDINSACTSFTVAFLNAYGLLASGMYKNCLVIGSDTYSRILNWKDRSTCVLFGDGAGAMVIAADKTKKGILSHYYSADGHGAEYIMLPAGGSKNPPANAGQLPKEDLFFKMDGKKVYEFTLSKIPDAAEYLIEKAKITTNDLDWIVLHQANARIIDAVARRLKLSKDKFIITIDTFGNTASASIPIALDAAVNKNAIRPNDLVMMIGFGGGLSWGGVIFEW